MKVIALAIVLVLCAPFVVGALATLLITTVVEARYPPLGRFVEVPGGRLQVVEAGPPEGEIPVLLLHGASGSSADPMSALGRRLAGRFRVIALDRPGHGWSDRIAPDAASPAVQARIVCDLLDRLGIARAIVVGHSWAGALATNLALDHPDRVAGLVLLAPVTHPWPGGDISWYYGPATSAIGWLFTRTITAPVGWLWLDAALRSVFAPQVPPPEYAEAARVPLVLRPGSFQANAQDVAGLYGFVAGQSGRYGEIRAPTVIVAGDADGIVSTGIHAQAIARQIPDARLVVLPGVGHMVHVVAADTVVAEIEALAGRLTASR